MVHLCVPRSCSGWREGSADGLDLDSSRPSVGPSPDSAFSFTLCKPFALANELSMAQNIPEDGGGGRRSECVPTHLSSCCLLWHQRPAFFLRTPSGFFPGICQEVID